MNKRKLLTTSSLCLLLTMFTVSAVSAITAVRKGFRFTDQFETTGVSGVAGEPIETPTYGSTYAVYGLEWTERSDRPCSLTALLDHIYDSEQHYVSQTIHRCGSRGPKEASKKEMDFLKVPGQGAVHFANSIEVCLNRAGTRVKGFRMVGLRLNPETGRLDPITGVDTNIRQWRTNCEEVDRNKNWQPAAICPAGSIAVALVGQYDNSDPPRSLTGVALKCRFLEFTDENGTRPVG